MLRLSVVTLVSLSLSACAPVETRNAPAAQPAEAGISQPVIIGGAVVLSSHHRDEWPDNATHELELRAGRAVYAGSMRPARG